MMRRGRIQSLLTLVVAAFFAVGGAGNIFASETILADYARWGYPSWFHYVTGSLELATAGLLAWPQTRVVGVMLGSVIMLSAVATVVAQGEHAHAVAPLVVLILIILVGVGVDKASSLPFRSEPVQ